MEASEGAKNASLLEIPGVVTKPCLRSGMNQLAWVLHNRKVKERPEDSTFLDSGGRDSSLFPFSRTSPSSMRTGTASGDSGL